MVKIIDLSMDIYFGMPTFPRIVPPVIKEIETHAQYGNAIGVTKEKYGDDEITNHCIIVMGDHIGTHIDSLWHGNSKSNISAEKIPLDYCYGDGVLLNFSFKEPGEYITKKDLEQELNRINYKLKPRDIVLIRTDCATKYGNSPDYLKKHPGLDGDAARWLWENGIRVFGVDAPTVEVPFEIMLKTGKLWPVHRLMREIDLYHIENLTNLDKIPRQVGFKVAVFPIKLVKASASPIRAVALID
ncbi:MAG: cyclase family protein [Caldisphaera sp.]